MKSLTLALLAPAIATAEKLSTLLKTNVVTPQQYASGEVHMAIMNSKEASWAARREAGVFDATQYKSLAAEAASVPCVNGLATVVDGDPLQTFKCKNLDLTDFKSHADLGSSTGEGASSWGWTSSDGREFGAIAQADGTAFVEISSTGKLIYLGRLPQQSVTSIWREIRGYKNYFIIGSEALNHGIQIFDATKLLSLNGSSPKTFSTTKDLTSLFTGLPAGRTHNVVVNEEKNYAVSVGAQPRSDKCASGLIFIDLKDVANPTTPGCAAQDGYVHDAQCLVYRGPDTTYQGKDICYGYNEDTLTIYDVTDKTKTSIISRTTYNGASYTHQGWVLDTQYQEYLLLDDEYDEEDKAGSAADGFPVTYIWDIRKLSKPVLTGFYKSSVKSIDHNQYVWDGIAYQSNYGSGLRVLDVSSVTKDPTGKSVKEIAYFDIYPENDGESGGGTVEFVGTWSHFANFKSGYILINTIERGAFVVKNNQFEKRARGEHFNKPRNV